MDVCKLGFFNQKNPEFQNRDLSLPRLILNLRDTILRQIFCAYLQQELSYLITNNFVNQKQNYLSKGLKLKLGKRRAKRRLISSTKPRIWVDNTEDKPEVFHP